MQTDERIIADFIFDAYLAPELDFKPLEAS
jgi:hypothetical protein